MKFFRLIKLLFYRKPKFRAFQNNEMAVEAFRHNGKIYYHFTDSFKMPAARALCAMAVYSELQMRCTKEYLLKHIRATEAILNPVDKKINLTALALINNNLKERLELMPFPDHIYKLASVIFFDETESPFNYDFSYNNKKIEEWKKSPELIDFFLRMPFSDLMPFSNISKERAGNYFRVAEMINEVHVNKLSELLSKQN